MSSYRHVLHRQTVFRDRARALPPAVAGQANPLFVGPSARAARL